MFTVGVMVVVGSGDEGCVSDKARYALLVRLFSVLISSVLIFNLTLNGLYFFNFILF